MSEQIKSSKKEETNVLPKISKGFVTGNQKFCKDIKSKNKRGGPYSQTDRIARRNEVYKLYFEYGYSAKKISELMNINRNTINGDVQFWHGTVIKNWRNSDVEFFVVRHIERLELNRTRLREYLDKTNNLQEKLAIEKMILEVESKIGQTQLKLSASMEKVHEKSTRWVNEWMEKNKHKDRYISYGDLMRVPSKSHEKIRKLLNEK